MGHTHNQNWLLGIAAGLVALHLTVVYHLGKPDLFTGSLLFWITACHLIWKRRDQLDFNSGIVSSLLGATVLGVIFYKSLHLFEADFFLRLAPMLSLLGWGLLASGGRGLKQYWRELFLLAFLAIPWELIYLFDISLVTAKFSAFMLWLLGFEVTRQGVWVTLPTGSVEVYNGCSGVRMMAQLLGLSWIVLAIAPIRWPHKIGLPLIAILLGFGINGIRVALMTILVALSDLDGFKYWHVGEGSLIFSAISVLIFGMICVGAIAPLQESER